MLKLIPGVATYDMVFNHNIFLQDIYQFLHNDTFTFTILRHPHTNFLSSFNFFSMKGGYEYLTNISGPSRLDTYFTNPDKYEPNVKSLSFTNNRQSIDLGFDAVNHKFNDTQYIQSFIERLEKSLDVVLITEYFDQSVILLKRLLGWTTQDVLYFTKIRTPTDKKFYYSLTEQQKKILTNRTAADSRLYAHFLDIFKHKISTQVGLDDEVAEFREILGKLVNFCVDRHPGRTNQFLVPAGRWSDEISIVRSKCKWLDLRELDFTDYFKQEQAKDFDWMV